MDENKLLRRKIKATNEGNLSTILSVCTDLATIYQKQGKHQLAINEFTTISKIYKQQKNALCYAQTTRGIGEAYLGLHQFEKALEQQCLYLELASKENNKLEEQRALATIGHTYLTWYLETSNEPNSSHLKNAYKYFMKSLMVCESLTGISKLEIADMSARLFSNLGVVQECMGNYEKALELLNRSIAICKQNDIYEQLYRGYISMAALYEKKEDYHETIRNYNLAIDIAKKLKDKLELLCAAYLSKSEVLTKLGDFHGSKHVLIKAYKAKSPITEDKKTIERNLRIVAAMCSTEDELIVTSDDQLKIKQLFERMGDGACELKNYDKAIEYYKKMLEAAERSGATCQELASCYYSLAETYKDNGQFNTAVEYFEKELEICSNKFIDNLNTLSKIADTKEAGGAPMDEVKNVYQRSFTLCQKNGSLKEEKRMVRRLTMYLKRNNYLIETSKMETYLRELEEKDPLKEELSSNSDTGDSDVQSNIGDGIILSDLTDLSDDCNNENLENPQNVPHARRKSRQFLVKKNIKGESQLHTACISGSMKVVKHLIDQGHPINIRDNCGWLPLHEACICGHLEIVQLLLDKGAAINDRGGTLCNGVTPIYDAASNGHLHIIELLLDRGASAIVKTDDGLTPFHTLTEWKKRTNPEGAELVLCEKILTRLSEALQKSGQQVKAVPFTRSSPVYKSNKENRDISQSRLGRARRTVDMDDFEDADEEVLSDGSANEYRKVISVLRNKRTSSFKNCSNSGTSSKPAHVEAAHDKDDWLDDDLCENASKRRKTNSYESLFSGKISPRGNQQTVSPKESSQKISPITNLNITLDEVMTIPETLSLDKSCDEPVEIPRSSVISRSRTMSTSSSKRKNQSSLLDSGFDRKRIISHNIRSTKLSSQKPRLQQTKMSSFSRTNSISDSEVQCLVSSSDDAAQNQEKVHTMITTNPTMFVDVRIEGRLYRVPVLMSHLQTHSIKWLAEQAANRYAKKSYMQPTLELETKSGAVLADEDLLSLLFPLGSMQAEQVEARVLKWNLPPLVDRYKETCTQMNIDFNNGLCKRLEEISVSLSLSNESMDGVNLAPLCKAINHQTNLLELDLSGNFLTIHCIQMLCSGLPTLDSLYKLNLSCVGLCSNSLGSLSAALCGTKRLQKLVDLDLSDNPLKNKSLFYLIEILKHINLTKLNLSNVSFTKSLLVDASNINVEELSLKNIESLDISDNALNTSTIMDIFITIDWSKLSNLNLSRNKSSNFGILKCLFNLLKSHPTIHLKTLNVSRCNIEDGELSDFLTLPSLMLSNINLSYNKNLTSLILPKILTHSSIQFLSINGCDNIFVDFIENGCGQLEFKNNTFKFGGKLDFTVDWSKYSLEANCLIRLFQNVFSHRVTVKQHLHVFCLEIHRTD